MMITSYAERSLAGVSRPLHWQCAACNVGALTDALALRIFRGRDGSAALIDNAAFRICRNQPRT